MKLKLDFIFRCLTILLLVGGLGSTASAQRTISGTVTDAESGDPLIGANVLVVGTSVGTVTDIDGKYSLNAPAGATQVEISYTGFSTQTVDMGASNVMNFKLAVGELLDEIVVVGYGSVRKKDATGAITSLTTEDFNAGIISSPEQLIQGRAAGVQITNSSGEPGAGINIRIRGTSSVSSDNNPLIVVDGVPLGGGDAGGGLGTGGSDSGFGSSSARNPLNFLNPNDIASIDILKDASATAIYGSRGANGVLLITTKTGTTNEGRLEYGYSLGLSSITNKYDLLDGDAYLDAYETFNGAAAREQQDEGSETDWQDEIFRTGISHNHTLAYGGGNEDGNYRFSLGYLDQEGIIETSGLKRLTARFNGTRNFIDDRLKISTQVIVSNIHDDFVAITDNAGFEGDLLGAALKANPTWPVRNEDGTFFQAGVTEPNPVAIIELSDAFANTVRALGNISAEYKIIDGLSFKTILGFDRTSFERRAGFSGLLVAPGIVDNGRLNATNIENTNTLWENYFTYKKEFGNLDFTGLLGYSYQEFDNSGDALELTNFRSTDLNVILNNFASADQSQLGSVVATNSARQIDELQSYFGRVTVGIDDKYLLTATMRADGSTRFGGNNKYGYFPSAAFKWRLIEEDFVPSFFDDLSLRVGYGITGNQAIPHNAYQIRFRYENFDINQGGDVNGGGLGAAVAQENPDLQWESTQQFNVGLDFAFAGTRVSGTLDLYRKNTEDLLIQQFAAQPAPSDFVFTNLDANIINQGVELGLDIAAVTKGDLRWNIIGNIAYNDNEVTNFNGLINTGAINGQGLTGAFAERIADGQPLYAFFLREFGGFDDNGNSIYVGGDVQQFTGDSPLPSVIAGLTNRFTYKGLDLNIFFSGQFGQSVYSNTANAFFTAGALANGRNVTTDVVGNGESNTNAPDVSTRFLQNASFVRLSNVTLGYNLDLKSDVFSGIRFYVTGQNLAVFTGYDGQDPEVDTNSSIDGIPSAGIDYTPFPAARTFIFGANVSF